MAELALKVGSPAPGDPTQWQDGDIISAFSGERISCAHVHHICLGAPARNGNNLIIRGGLAETFYQTTHRYRFERVSRTEILRTDFSLPAVHVDREKVIGPSEIDVPLYLARRAAAGNKQIFGERGAEVWYGGRKDFSTAKLDAIWAEIEARTPLRKADHSRLELSPDMRRQFLFVTVDDFDEPTRMAYEAPLVLESDPDRNPREPDTLVKLRQYRVNWRVLDLGVPAADIDDRTKEIDIRESRTFQRASIVVGR